MVLDTPCLFHKTKLNRLWHPFVIAVCVIISLLLNSEFSSLIESHSTMIASLVAQPKAIPL
jgi:hypothetical protein